jgi:hypothetical protein
MQSVIKFGLVVLSLLAPTIGPAARAAAADDYADTVLLSPEQGEAVAAFAAQSEKRIRSKPDCSHLVHLLYARAGLIYPYEDSRVLYRGVSDFKRVKIPQPGDLAVWLGHVGIVLSPEEKTFVSSVRSGILIESWTAPHWVRRGRPRFYRYRIGPEADMNLLARIMGEDKLPPTETPTSARNATSSQLPSSTSPATDDVEMDGSQAERAESSPQDAGSTEERGHDSVSIVATISQHQMPSRRQIVTAIMENSKARARKLIAGQALDVALPFSVFSRIEVEKIKVKHESGWVTLQLSETMCAEDGRILPARTMERELSISRHSDGIWVISDPQNRTYLGAEQALEIFERQAQLSLQNAPNSSSTRIVVKALDRVYDQQPGTPQRAAIR